jgi:hypothetical protein
MHMYWLTYNRIFAISLALLLAVPARATMAKTTSSAGPYTCDGSTTAFSIPFRFLAASDLQVIRTLTGGTVTTTLALGTDYAVTGAGDSSGTVALTSDSKCASGDTLTIKRVVPLTQATPFVTQGGYKAKAHELAFDRLTMGLQQVDGDREDLGATRAVGNAAHSTRDSGQGAAITNGDATSLAAIGAQVTAVRDRGGYGTIADNSSVLAAGSNSARMLKDRFAEVFNVKDYGAHTTNELGYGTFDSTAAFAATKAAIVAAGGGIMYLPPGTYRHTGTFTFPTTVPFTLQGDVLTIMRGGWARIEFQHDTAAPCIDIPVGDGNNDLLSASLRGLQLIGKNQLHDAVVRVTGRKFATDHVFTWYGQDGFQLNGIYTASLDHVLSDQAGRDGLRLNDANEIWVDASQFKFSGEDSVHIVTGTGNYFNADYSGPRNGAGIRIDSGYLNRFKGYFEDNSAGGWDALAVDLGTGTHHNEIDIFMSASKTVRDLGLANIFPAGQGLDSIAQVARGKIINQAPDSSFKMNASGWNSGASGATIAQDTTTGVTTNTSMKITANGAPGANMWAARLMPPTVHAGDTVLVTAWVKASRPMYRQKVGIAPLHTNFALQVNGPSSSDIIGEQHVLPYVDTTWRQVGNVYKIKDSASYSGSISTIFMIAASEPGDVLWVTDVMVVVNPPKDVRPFSIPYVMNEQTSKAQTYALRFPVEQVASEVNLGGDGVMRDARVRRSAAGVFEFGNASSFGSVADLGSATNPLRTVYASSLSLMGGTAATSVSGGQVKVSFTLPDIRLSGMTALLTITANPSVSSSTLYNGLAVYMVGITTGREGDVAQRLVFNPTPLLAGVSTSAGGAAPAIVDLHWGTGDRGSPVRVVGGGGKVGGTFSVVWNQQTGGNAHGATATLTILNAH